MAEVIRLKALTDLSCQKLADTFNRLYGSQRGVTVSKSWVALAIKRHHYSIADLREQWKRQQPAHLPRNRIWGLDLTGKADEAGNIHPILGVIDHGSRLALCMQALPDKRSVTILRCLLQAIGSYGLPRVIKTDNEVIFRSWIFRTTLSLLGIRQQFSQPGMPWQNGRIERLFGTLKEKLHQLRVEDSAALRLAINDFCFWYNVVRPHHHLDGRTPMEAWHGIDPYRQRPKRAYLFEAWDGLLKGVWLRH